MSIILKDIREFQLNFGKHLKSLRLSRHWSQSNLSAISDLEKTSISRLENGRTNATLKTIYILARAFDIKPSELLDF